MKSPVWILQALLEDAALWCEASTARDFKTITSRVKHEGESFLTITLPAFATAFEGCLKRERITPSDFPAFGSSRGRALPRFLGGLLARVFDSGTGCLLDIPDVNAIFYIRQICLVFKKVLAPCAPKRARKAFVKYVQTDSEIEDCIREIPSTLMHRFEYIAGTIFSTRLSGLNQQIMEYRHVPRHGPGATAERLSANGRYDVPVWYDRLDQYFPFDLFGVPNAGWLNTTTSVGCVEFLQREGPLWRGELTKTDDPKWSCLLNGSPSNVCHRLGNGRWPEGLLPARSGGGDCGSSGQAWRVRKHRGFLDVSLPAGPTESTAATGERPVRVIAVPKTQKGPRIIAIEPSCMQYTQQSILEILIPVLEQRFEGALGFTDQGPNRDLALRGSRDGKYATLDLSDASDRVHNLLVTRMLRTIPTLRDAVQACRSLTADVPSIGVIPLKKFASMGSALCFPIEAMVFLIIVLTALTADDNRLPSSRRLTTLLGKVRIYGDDIIVPTDKAYLVAQTLQAFGLKVNSDKSFWTGKFRESCGLDAYDGFEITPAYLRKEKPRRLSDALSVASWMSFRNQLYKRGCWRTTRVLDKFLSRIARFPIVAETSPVIGFISNLGYQVQRWNKDLQRFEVKGPVLVPTKRSDPLDGAGALMKFFLKRGDKPFEDPRHLECAGRPIAVNTKHRWALPY